MIRPAIFCCAVLLLAAATFALRGAVRLPSIEAAEISHPNTPPIYPGIKKEQTWIRMKDGVRLAVNLFMPDGAPVNGKASEKFPAILEYLPYRKDDWSLQRDVRLHSYFVRRGYVSARVDIRGTGASEGTPPDREYSEQELADGAEIIAWLARQPWSNGNVGMMGISWGGFNAIQMALRHPPALKAIIAVCATEELFHDDIHYIDGMMHADEFELSMDLQEMLPRAPEFPTDEQSLAPRFDNPPWFLLYLRQQRDGPFWRRASVAPDHYGEYKVPTFLVGGFLDGYRDSVARFFGRVNAPVKALLGPWNHTFPHDADPGPAIEWRAEAVRWWDYWLKGEQNGILEEPRFEVYMRHWYPPDPNIQEIPGEWRAYPAWPPGDQHTETLYLRPTHTLEAAPPAATAVTRQELKFVPSTGVEAGFWWGDFTTDQRPADAFSLIYDSAPLDKEVAILGWPEAVLRVTASAKLANWFVRLSDVAPDGAVTMITGAGQSGAQLKSASNPEELEPGSIYSVPVEMHLTSWVFARGHRIRLAISNALWPMIWPTPYPMTTSLILGGAETPRLELPVVSSTAVQAPRFAPPEESPGPPGVKWSGEPWPPQDWSVTRDLNAGLARVSWSGDDAGEFPWGSMKDHEQMSYEVNDARPDVNTVRGSASTIVELPGRKLVFSVALDLHSDAKNFYYHFERRLTENGAVVRQKSWEDTIPRDHQ